MKDSLGRTINYIRISVTDRCNMRCLYCMPEEGTRLYEHADMLTLEEMIRICGCMATFGISRVKLTGGEPLVRKNIVWLTEKLTAIPGITDVTMTTNGILLKPEAEALKQAGLSSVNVSLDTLDRDRFAMITRRDQYDAVLAGIAAAQEAGLRVKINCAVTEHFELAEVARFAEYSIENQIPVRFIEMMPIGQGQAYRTLDNDVLLHTLKETYADVILSEQSMGNGPAVYYTFSGNTGCVGFISAVHHQFCDRCNRVRLTSDGYLKLCLAQAAGLNLRDIIRNGSTDDELRQVIQSAIIQKPVSHQFGGRQRQPGVTMNQIGG
ncbi:MAG: GTP 3',8-cyclase MoaA [Lachnospiraceae bacterium]